MIIGYVDPFSREDTLSHGVSLYQCPLLITHGLYLDISDGRFVENSATKCEFTDFASGSFEKLFQRQIVK